MPTEDQRAAISVDEARHRAGVTAFPDRGDVPRIGGVGLEPELFPIVRDSEGRPAGRALLTQPGGHGVLEIIDELAASDDSIGPARSRDPGPIEYPVKGGGRLTFEPGGQVGAEETAIWTCAKCS